jgi:hypothetical protein
MLNKVLIFITALIVIINAGHALTNLNFTSLVVMIIFKFLLVIIVLYNVVKKENQLKIKQTSYQIIWVIIGFALIGFQKIEISIPPFNSSEKTIQYCTFVDVNDQNYENFERLEYRVKEFGLYDEEFSVEWVYPFLGVFEWRSTQLVSAQRILHFNEAVDMRFNHCYYTENNGYLTLFPLSRNDDSHR